MGDGTSRRLLDLVRQAAEAARVDVEVVGASVGGVADGDGDLVPVDQKVEGAPSVLYDAVMVLTATSAAPRLAHDPAVRDFVFDAFAHCKFIGYAQQAGELLAAVGLDDRMDDGFQVVTGPEDIDEFLGRCAGLRFWDRQAALV